MKIVVIDGRPGVFSWADGFKARREETLVELAQKDDNHLLQVCLWLENHGRRDEALVLLERVLR
jgi:hypothetical protein